MRPLFFIWGSLGFLFIVLMAVNPELKAPTDFASSVIQLWIGGMVFFGLGSILWKDHNELRARGRNE